jgi:hypothetical protein
MYRINHGVFTVLVILWSSTCGSALGQATARAAPLEIHVAPNGKDTNPGTRTKPLALKQAKPLVVFAAGWWQPVRKTSLPCPEGGS